MEAEEQERQEKDTQRKHSRKKETHQLVVEVVRREIEQIQNAGADRCAFVILIGTVFCSGQDCVFSLLQTVQCNQRRCGPHRCRMLRTAVIGVRLMPI